MARGPDPEASLAETALAFRSWLAERHDEFAPYREEYAEELAREVERYRPFQRLLWDEGWTKLGWSPELGGLGGSSMHRSVVAEEIAASGCVNPEILAAIEIVAPMLVRFAPHLAAKHVPAGMRGDEIWCQGFSEPDAGSDLGSLRTRAIPDEGGFRINGQKMWSSNGAVSSWSCVLARTGDPDSGYRGLTMFWVDLSSPGVRVVPTELGSGRSDTAEIFLDDVFVPNTHVVGEVGQGWTAVMHLLQFERGAYAWERQATMHTQLTELLTDHGQSLGPQSDETAGNAYLALFALRSQVRDTIERLSIGEELGPEISVDKILMSTAEQTTTESARKLLYPRLELADTSDEYAQLWRRRWAYSRITTIYGGAIEVQRDLVSERLLGLPRGR